MRTDDFDYHLPKELIATQPRAERAASRMLVIDRRSGIITHDVVASFAKYLEKGDLCVLNNTRVMPARHYSNDGRKEILRLNFSDPLVWRCMVRPGRKFRLGHAVSIGTSEGKVIEIFENGERLIAFDTPVDSDVHGRLALPHYMERESDEIDIERYQTTFASENGAIAAPTAGLHFTDRMLSEIRHAFVTLHVGAGTFQPVHEDEIENHRMHSESYRITQEAALAINEAARVVAIGTTVARVLEHVAHSGRIIAQSGETRIFIYPPYQFRRVDALLTNFHLPKSTLLMLVSAMAGRDLVMKAYAEAIQEGYRFYSYGDCMLIL